ncbi:MAG: DUF2726 domain-containing protein [Phycisphaeraceae bacterium]|nr:DUF2726 domain-containing protein [Phycisphaeraceae bacterium]
MWFIVAAVLVLVAAAWFVVAKLSARAAEERAERVRRYAIRDTGERLGFAPSATETSADPQADTATTIQYLSRGPGDEIPAASIEPDLASIASAEPGAGDGGTHGRLVTTPDGEMILTTPPFSQRPTLLSNREAEYAAAIRKRLPESLVLCPKVRLESMVMPTPPDGRDPADWRTWRKRVRVRAVDLVICDARTWRPVLAIEIDQPGTHARQVAGGVDRMVDEVLATVGIPLVRCRGDDASADWPMIAPYLAGAAGK